MEFFFLLVVLGIPVGLGYWAYWAFYRRPYLAALQNVAQSSVEERMIRLFEIDPSLTDEAIAQLVRDELVNERVREQTVYAWAIPETAARIRRTAIRLAIEAGAKAASKKKRLRSNADEG